MFWLGRLGLVPDRSLTPSDTNTRRTKACVRL